MGASMCVYVCVWLGVVESCFFLTEKGQQYTYAETVIMLAKLRNARLM